MIIRLDKKSGRQNETNVSKDIMDFIRCEVCFFGVPNYDWYYVRSDNTVYFDIVPESNDLVEVAYPYLPIDLEIDVTIPFN